MASPCTANREFPSSQNQNREFFIQLIQNGYLIHYDTFYLKNVLKIFLCVIIMNLGLTRDKNPSEIPLKKTDWFACVLIKITILVEIPQSAGAKGTAYYIPAEKTWVPTRCRGVRYMEALFRWNAESASSSENHRLIIESTEKRIMVGTWFGEICSCCCLPVLPDCLGPS